jgi:hypothetical protein
MRTTRRLPAEQGSTQRELMKPMQPGAIGRGLIAGLIATIVLSAAMLFHSMWVMPELDPIGMITAMSGAGSRVARSWRTPIWKSIGTLCSDLDYGRVRIATGTMGSAGAAARATSIAKGRLSRSTD